MADSRIKSVADLLSSFFDKDLAREGQQFSGFGRAWKAIAGARLGEHSHPADIKHGILIVETEHQGWTQLLQLQQDRILEEIQRRFPDLGIRGIAWRLGNEPKVAAVAATPRIQPAAGPIVPAAENEAEKAREEKAEEKRGLPPDMVATFARIRKNINK
ncbi:MAG: hypothetical protein CVV53_06980 [Spirochaetae bacterium HGW-Spirochaetae-9]|nr:MAG: hypothetical protein CVV53_06980 [Spirochaetae bacterium HGW-Spirochaetae-9]